MPGAPLVMPRQRRIHFSSESDPRRNKILDTIIDLGLTATIYDAGRPADERSARWACLSRLVVDLAEMRAELSKDAEEGEDEDNREDDSDPEVVDRDEAMA